MTLCEFYRNQFEKAKEDRHFEADSKYCTEIHGRGTYEWFKAMSTKYFGGGFLYQYTKAGITSQQLQQAKENGYIKYKYYSNWQARQLNQTDWYGLTIKGLKALYKAYPEWC